MKRFCAGVIVVCLMVCSRGFAQVELIPIAPVRIEATVNETTSLIFPFDITTADWGSNGIIVSRVKTAKNILQVKAACKDFVSTNLSVITMDGNFYAFQLEYNAAPTELNYIVRRDTSAVVANVSNNAVTLQREREQVHSAHSFLHVQRTVMLTRLRLSGVYAGQQAMWLKMNLSNRSWIDFPIGYVRFFIKDRRIFKRRVTQEKEIIPVYADSISQIQGKQKADMVYGLAPFTVPKGRCLVVQVGERGEGRFIDVKIAGTKDFAGEKTDAVMEKEFEESYADGIREKMGHDAGHIWTHLVEEQQQGKEWVAYPDVEKVSKEDLQVFETAREAMAYCNGHDTYEYDRIDRVEGALAPVMEALIEKHIEQYPPQHMRDKDEELEL